MEKKRIVIITTGWFPEGDAGAVRLHMIAKAMVTAGYDVQVLCRNKQNDSGCVDSIHYFSLRRRDGHKLVRVIDYCMFPDRIRYFLNKNKDLSCVYIYNAHISVFNYCKSFCREHHIQLIHDCVEWYSPEEFKCGKKSWEYKTKSKINTQIIDKSFSVIAISRYLEEYFSGKGIHTLRVPILCDVYERKAPIKYSDSKLTLFYAGAPLRKDLVGNVLDAALMLTLEERAKLRFVLVGADKNYLIQKSSIPEETIEACSGFLELYGRIPRDEVLQKMEQADFCVLPRNANLRYAKAGFPSKVVEALSNATPILCNLSSDLGEYLIDGYNAILARDHEPEALAEALRRALHLSTAEKDCMKENAFETAKRHFDYRLYSEAISSFMGMTNN